MHEHFNLWSIIYLEINIHTIGIDNHYTLGFFSGFFARSPLNSSNIVNSSLIAIYAALSWPGKSSIFSYFF